MRVWTRGVESGFVAMPRAVTVSGRDQLAFNTRSSADFAQQERDQAKHSAEFASISDVDWHGGLVIHRLMITEAHV
jgi:hypothetical protein